MKKTSFLSLSVFLSLFSCTVETTPQEQIDTLYSDAILSSRGRVRVVPPPGDPGMVTPFHTVVSGAVYCYAGTYLDAEIEELEEDFQFLVSYYSALCDRHYDYTVDGAPLTNLKVLNEAERGTPVHVDSFLYDLLSESFRFSLESRDEEGRLRFDIFTGAVNDLYEDKLDDLEPSALEQALSLANGGRTFSSDIDSSALEEALWRTPSNYDECKDLLTFDPEEQTVTFHPFERDGVEVDGVEISLSGVGKGFATQRITEAFQERHEDISLLISSGTSSIKAVGDRPDGREWAIRLSNPVSLEAPLEERNPYEVGYRKGGPFSLSTSGFAENHFYVYEPGTDTYRRRDHIVDPTSGLSVSYFDQVSVLLEDAGLADMYTTALMLTQSVEEAMELKNHLDEAFGVTSEALLLRKSDKEGGGVYRLRHSDLSPLSSGLLPIVERTDGTTYEGDYSDLSPSEIARSVTTSERDYAVTYFATEGFFEDLEIIRDGTVPYPDDVLARIEEIA